MMVYKFCPYCATPLEEQEHGGRVRLACPKGDFVHWDNPTPVVAAVVERQGKVVLVQSIGWPKEWFGLVTGFLEKGEKPEEAVLREVKEELGLEA
ncbi:MAG: NUDIX domain-containing protein, partial [Bacteroidota bacterium]